MQKIAFLQIDKQINIHGDLVTTNKHNRDQIQPVKVSSTHMKKNNMRKKTEKTLNKLYYELWVIKMKERDDTTRSQYRNNKKYRKRGPKKSNKQYL